MNACNPVTTQRLNKRSRAEILETSHRTDYISWTTSIQQRTLMPRGRVCIWTAGRGKAAYMVKYLDYVSANDYDL